jgi:hypothetical protein
MKNRNWLCYSLDLIGLAALTGAGLSLIGALWLSASAAEALLLSTFSYCLMGAVGAFLAARMWEISQVLQKAPEVTSNEPLKLPNNVETLPQREPLQRAA